MCLVLQVSFLSPERSVDAQLMASRALTFLADVLPSSCASLVRHGAIPALCAQLVMFPCIEIAEQSLQVR